MLKGKRGYKAKVIRHKNNVEFDPPPEDKIQTKIDFLKTFDYIKKDTKDPLKKLQESKLFADTENDVHIERMKKVWAYRSG